MSKFVKTAIWALVIAFLVFYLVTRPETAAQIVKQVFGVFDALGRFFNTLAK